MKVLALDDDVVILKAISHRLNQEGYEVHSSQDARVIKEYLAEEKYDLLILDIVMPHFSGIEVISWVKEHYADLKIIFVSALDKKEIILKTFELGASDFIIKPLNLDELVLRIEQLFKTDELDNKTLLT